MLFDDLVIKHNRVGFCYVLSANKWAKKWMSFYIYFFNSAKLIDRVNTSEKIKYHALPLNIK
jgi:hypothetical protein